MYLPFKVKWKLLGSTQQGCWKPLLWVKRHTGPSQKGNQAHIFLCAYCAWREIIWLGHCSFKFSTKYMEISYHSKILLRGQWSLVTPSSCFCPISKPFSCFPTSSSLCHQPDSGLGAALSIRMDCSNCMAIVYFGSFSQIQVFIHLGAPSPVQGALPALDES